PAAEQNAEQWSKLYAAKSPADHAGIVMALAESKRDGGATPRELEAYLSANRDTVAKAQSEHQPRIDVMLGEAVLARGDLGAARLHFSRAAAYDVLPLIERLREEDSALGDRRLGRALMAMGDAKLWLADQARDAAMKLVIRKADADSLQKKRAAVAEAEKLYGEIPALQPVPPPTSTVEAAARVARMRGQLWAQAHLALGAEAAEPMLADAQMAYRMCVSLGAKFQVVTPGSRACAAWLTRHFPSESPRLGEIMPSPKWSGLRFGPPVPLDRDGEPPAVKSR
ncbi:MAG: hypothetical protein JNK04_06105, partial [Myxococcales bacterium]|nr:hypothetical protein [Myxococcales bacterium]